MRSRVKVASGRMRKEGVLQTIQESKWIFQKTEGPVDVT